MWLSELMLKASHNSQHDSSSQRAAAMFSRKLCQASVHSLEDSGGSCRQNFPDASAGSGGNQHHRWNMAGHDPFNAAGNELGNRQRIRFRLEVMGAVAKTDGAVLSLRYVFCPAAVASVGPGCPDKTAEQGGEENAKGSQTIFRGVVRVDCEQRFCGNDLRDGSGLDPAIFLDKMDVAFRAERHRLSSSNCE